MDAYCLQNPGELTLKKWLTFSTQTVWIIVYCCSVHAAV